MKRFEDILAYSQEELKNYLGSYLRALHREVIKENGYIYSPAKGDDAIPVLLTAHMDKTPNVGGKKREKIKEISKIKEFKNNGDIITKWSSPQGIGGDDRCGVWMIMNIIKKYNVSVLFCEDEEIGSVGARKFCKSKHVKNVDVKYMIELDRKGSKDLVFYSCDNAEFTKWLEEKTGYKTAQGTMSDISELMPETMTAGVNFSCGYYSEHTLAEYIIIEEMNNTLETVMRLLEEEIPQKFKYEARKYSYYGRYGGYGYDDWDYYNNYGAYGKTYGSYGSSSHSSSGTNKSSKRVYSSFANQVDFHVVISEEYEDLFDKKEYIASGKDKAEAIAKMFFGVPDLAMSLVEDYWFE